MKRATTCLIAVLILLNFCTPPVVGKPPCTDGCRSGGRTRTTRNPWRMSDGDRKKYLDDRLSDYRDEFYGGGGQDTLDRLRDKLGPYKDFWTKWRHDYQDLPRGSKERQEIVDKLRWVREVLRGGLDLKKQFESSVVLTQPGSGDGGTTTPTGGTDATTPTGGTNTPTPTGGSPAKSGGVDALTWFLVEMANQEQDPQLRANMDALVAEAVTRAANQNVNASEGAVQNVIREIKGMLERKRNSQNGAK